MKNFNDDGIEIIREFAKKKGQYFSKRGWHLVGCETHIMLPPNEKYQNVLFQGYLDVVLYHEPTNKFKIIDIKPFNVVIGVLNSCEAIEINSSFILSTSFNFLKSKAYSNNLVFNVNNKITINIVINKII